jgi:hypothetical protein
MNETSEFAREWTELLNEIRVALPGVQMLFGFLVAAAFTDSIARLPASVRAVYFACFLFATTACAFLIAPSVYHRLHWRRDVVDKEQMLRTCNTLALVGALMLAVAMTTGVYVLSWVLTGTAVADLVATAAGLMFFTLWFALPITRRNREHPS